jgi:glucosyl-dolichyl phosphate glucuronosyltransferase
MNITVVLCTYNNCELLAKALNSLAASVLPPSVEWEVLVMDNNSTDQTRQVAQEFSRQHPDHFRYLFEPHPGKSYALNSGVREARGEILAFLDDDVTVEPTWLQNLTSALHNGDWAGSGGRIVLQWPASLPRWLVVKGPRARFPFPAFDQGPEAKELVGPPFGANMAFRKCMFEKYGGFRTDLGPSPTTEIPRPGEDTEFGRRVIAGGERLRYEPSAVVYHPVTEKRIDKEYFLRWWFDCGRADIRASGVRPGTRCYVAGVPLYVIRRLAAWTLRWLFTLDPALRFSCKVTVWQKAGEIFECRRRWRDARAQGNVAGEETKRERDAEA